jgi:hypothetical protein
MTKRPYDSISASPHAQLPGRQASHDAEADGSHEEADGSTLKKPRSFMATLVRTLFVSIARVARVADHGRPVTYAGRGKQDATKTAQNAATAKS